MKPVAVSVRGLGGASALGGGIREQMDAMRTGVPPLRPLAGHPDCGGVRPDLLAGWIDDRSWLAGRKYGGAANAAVRAARMAVAEAGWTEEDLVDCHVFSGSSRGNTGELLGYWRSRRPVRKLAASNSMHSETASAVSIELGIRGPWMCLSNGCSSGLDALVLAYQALASGGAVRALVIGVDFPLLPELLDAFLATGLLSRNNVNNPYADETTGFLPGEAVAVLALEVGDFPGPRVLAALANSDAYDNVAPAPLGRPTVDLLEKALRLPQLEGRTVTAVCPHASGTAAHGAAEKAALDRVFNGPPRPPVSLHFMKPWTGHSLGASGAIDCVLLCAFMRENLLPPNLPGLASPCPLRLPVPAEPLPFDSSSCVLKISAGMGGRNTVVAFSLPI
jgi:3-oxoacyl-(acyl-carrier-protein) synthase